MDLSSLVSAAWLQSLITILSVLWLLFRILQVFHQPVDNLISLLGLEVPPTPSVGLCDIKADGVILQWKSPAQKPNYLKHYILLNGVNVGDLPPGAQSVRLTRLLPDKQYTICVVAKNRNFQSVSRHLRVWTKPYDSHEFFDDPLPYNDTVKLSTATPSDTVNHPSTIFASTASGTSKISSLSPFVRLHFPPSLQSDTLVACQNRPSNSSINSKRTICPPNVANPLFNEKCNVADQPIDGGIVSVTTNDGANGNIVTCNTDSTDPISTSTTSTFSTTTTTLTTTTSSVNDDEAPESLNLTLETIRRETESEERRIINDDLTFEASRIKLSGERNHLKLLLKEKDHEKKALQKELRDLSRDCKLTQFKKFEQLRILDKCQSELSEYQLLIERMDNEIDKSKHTPDIPAPVCDVHPSMNPNHSNESEQLSCPNDLHTKGFADNNDADNIKVDINTKPLSNSDKASCGEYDNPLIINNSENDGDEKQEEESPKMGLSSSSASTNTTLYDLDLENRPHQNRHKRDGFGNSTKKSSHARNPLNGQKLTGIQFQRKSFHQTLKSISNKLSISSPSPRNMTIWQPPIKDPSETNQLDINSCGSGDGGSSYSCTSNLSKEDSLTTVTTSPSNFTGVQSHTTPLSYSHSFDGRLNYPSKFNSCLTSYRSPRRRSAISPDTVENGHRNDFINRSNVKNRHRSSLAMSTEEEEGLLPSDLLTVDGDNVEVIKGSKSLVSDSVPEFRTRQSIIVESDQLSTKHGISNDFREYAYSPISISPSSYENVSPLASPEEDSEHIDLFVNNLTSVTDTRHMRPMISDTEISGSRLPRSSNLTSNEFLFPFISQRSQLHTRSDNNSNPPPSQIAINTRQPESNCPPRCSCYACEKRKLTNHGMNRRSCSVTCTSFPNFTPGLSSYMKHQSSYSISGECTWELSSSNPNIGGYSHYSTGYAAESMSNSSYLAYLGTKRDPFNRISWNGVSDNLLSSFSSQESFSTSTAWNPTKRDCNLSLGGERITSKPKVSRFASEWSTLPLSSSPWDPSIYDATPKNSNISVSPATSSASGLGICVGMNMDIGLTPGTATAAHTEYDSQSRSRTMNCS